MSVPILPPWSGGDTGTTGGTYPRPDGSSGYQPPTGPGGGAGTPGIAPGGPISPEERKSVWDDFYARLPKPSDFWTGLGIIGGSVGVYLILLVLFGLGVWGLLEGSGGAVGYVAAPRPFARPRGGGRRRKGRAKAAAAPDADS